MNALIAVLFHTIEYYKSGMGVGRRCNGCELVGIFTVLLLQTVIEVSGYTTTADFLYPHNVARAEVGLPPLHWDYNVAAYAQWYASVRQLDCRLVHSGVPNLGENIFQGDGSGWTAENAVEDWVSERAYYDYYSNSCEGGRDCGHYTQIVWRGTTAVGCARVDCLNGGVFITCNYSPPGNYVGKRPF